MSKKGLIKSTGVISSATLLSRILGFVRDIVIANFFGTALYAQAFVVAFRIPNLLRDLIGEGATNAAFVPVLTDELTKKGRHEFFKLAQVLFNILLTVLTVMVVIGIFASPIIVRLIAPGFFADKEKFDVTVTLTKILFPFLLLVGLWAYAMGVLNTLGHFAAPAFGPAILNMAMIVSAAWFGENVFGLASGVLAGGALQLLIQFPPLYMHGWRPRVSAGFVHPKAKKAGALLIPRAMGACVYQINVFINTIIASLSSIVGEGAVAALYYANRVWQMPLAIFGIALAQAALPKMSRHAALNDTARLKETLVFSLKILFFILVPASVGLAVISEPIVRVLFERGAFTAYSTGITSSALFFYALGLVACGGIKVLVSAFYSLHDTMTPVKTAAVSLILNILFILAFMWPLKTGGLALATSLSAVFNFAALYMLLEKKIGPLGTASIADSFVRVLASAIVMGAALKICVSFYSIRNAAVLCAVITAGIAVFLSASYALKVKELRDFLEWMIKRR